MLNFSSKSQQLQIAMELYQSQNYIQAINILEHLEESDKQLFYLSKCYENISLEKSRDLKIYFITNLIVFNSALSKFPLMSHSY